MGRSGEKVGKGGEEVGGGREGGSGQGRRVLEGLRCLCFRTGVAVTCSTTHHNCRHKCSTVGGRQETQTGKN